MTRKHDIRSARAPSEWEPPSEPRLSAPLLLVTGTCLAWWALSLLLSPVWLAIRKPEHGILDDIWSLGDGQ
jgi:hypothetical protein